MTFQTKTLVFASSVLILLIAVASFIATGRSAAAHGPDLHVLDTTLADMRAVDQLGTSVGVLDDSRQSADEVDDPVALDFADANEIYLFDRSRLLARGENYGFWVVPTLNAQVCVVGFAPRSEYAVADDKEFTSASSCREQAQFDALGIVLTMGPHDAQRGVALLPNGAENISRNGSTTPVTRNAVEIGLHSADDPESMVSLIEEGRRGVRDIFTLPSTAVLNP